MITLLDLPKIEKENEEFKIIKAMFDNIRSEYLTSYGRTKKNAQKKFDNLRYKYLNTNGQLFLSEQENKLFEQVHNWQPFNSSAISPWFDPKWIFGVEEFDIVIGNPPYVQLQKIQDKQAKEQYKKAGFVTHKSTGDLYGLFYERGVNLLKDNGFLCYITSNKWMRAGYGDVLRGFFAQYNPIKLLDFAGFKVFENATVDTNILLLEKASNQNNTLALHFQNDYKKGNDLAKYINKNAIINTFNDSDTWAILSPIEQSIKAKIERIGTPLKDWDININYGIKTGYNEAFIITGEQKDELIRQDLKSAEIIKPILRGKDIKKYAYNFADLWLIATHNGYTDNKGKTIKRIDINDYPAVKNHLDNHWKKIQKRYDKGDTPYNLRNCAYFEEFEKEKIVWSDISTKPNFCLLEKGIYFNNTVYMISGNDLKYINLYLNSSLIKFYFPLISSGLGDKGSRYFKQFVELLPCPNISTNQKELFIELYKNIIKEKANNQDTTELEKEVDNLIYKLYELTDEEIAFIESKIQ